MFNLEKYAKECKIRVSSANLTIRDMRTGEKQEVMFYRPGGQFPVDLIRRELAKYGYDLEIFALPDPPEANIDWELVYKNMEGHHIDYTFDPQEIFVGGKND